MGHADRSNCRIKTKRANSSHARIIRQSNSYRFDIYSCPKTLGWPSSWQHVFKVDTFDRCQFKCQFKRQPSVALRPIRV